MARRRSADGPGATRKRVEALDRDDIRILNELLRDARLSYRQIATHIGLSTATVAQRYRSLEKRGVILGSVPVLDYEKIGYAFCVLTLIKVKQGRLFEAMRKIGEDPHVFGVYDHTGGTDVTVLARFRDRKSLDGFLKVLQAIPSIERTETHLILNVFKENVRHLPDTEETGG